MERRNVLRRPYPTSRFDSASTVQSRSASCCVITTERLQDEAQKRESRPGLAFPTRQAAIKIRRLRRHQARKISSSVIRRNGVQYRVIFPYIPNNTTSGSVHPPVLYEYL